MKLFGLIFLLSVATCLPSTELQSIIQSSIVEALGTENKKYLNPKFLKRSSLVISRMLNRPANSHVDYDSKENAFYTRTLKSNADGIFTSIAISLRNIASKQITDESRKKIIALIDTCKGFVTDKDGIEQILKELRLLWFEARHGKKFESAVKTDDWLTFGALSPYICRELRAIGFSDKEIKNFEKRVFNDNGVYQVLRNLNNPNAAGYMVNWKRVHNLHDEIDFKMNANRAKMKGIAKDGLRGTLRIPTHVYYNGMQYSILELLGHGNGGVAYRAKDNNGENVVFKFARPYDVNDPYDLFERETKNLQRTDRFIYADQENRILIFKMIPGITYAEYLSNIFKKFTESGLSDIEYEDLRKKVHLYNSALKDFHAKYGLLHGDVRPLNAIITPDGKMELIDLGNSEVSSVDPIVFSEQMRSQYAMGKLELFYWASWALAHFRRNTIADDYRLLLILQATPGRENEAQAFCQHYQETHNLPADTCQILEMEFHNLQAKTKDLVSQTSPTLEDLNSLAKDLRKRFMFIEEGMIDLKLSFLYGT